MTLRRGAGTPRRHRLRPPSQRPEGGINFGWRVHVAQEAWTAKVDVKASIVLALAGATMAAVTAGQSDFGPFADLLGWRVYAFRGAVIAGSLSVLLSFATIFPRLGPTHRKRNMDVADLVYFGHLRHLDPKEVATRLTGLTVNDELRALSRQLVAMSRHNWRKHRLLQWALLALAAAYLALTVVAFWP